MKNRWMYALAIAGVITAFAVSVHAGDWALKAQGVNPFYPTVSEQVEYTGGAVDTTRDDHALNAVERNPFYVGTTKTDTPSYVGGDQVTIDDPSLKNAEVNPLY